MTTPPPDILAVDDTPANLTLLSGILKKRGYRVRPVPSGELALAAAVAETPDLILLDISMPELDGFEVCTRLKADPVLRDVPVIFLTAHTDIGDKVRAFAVGGVDYVTKPFQAEEIEARVATHLALRRQQRELEERNDRLAELERLRDGLVHMLVHDLRSPLCVVLWTLEMVSRDAAATPFHTDITECLSSARKMVGMVTEILDVNKLDAAAMPLTPERFDLLELVHETLRELRPMAEKFRVSIAPEVPVPIIGDRRLLARVVANLVTNALQFSPRDGAVRIAIEPGADNVRFTISDDGPGVPEASRTSIFEKFGAVGQRPRRYSTGLGLPFCKLALDAHGGTIGVEAGPNGKASTFWFSLPVRAG